MFTNALRCIESDYPQLLGLAQMMGVIQIIDGVIYPVSGCGWDYIGYKRVGEIPAEGEPDNRPFLTDGNGNKYVHINARTPFSVGAAAAQAAASSPEVAAALGDPSRFFVTDGNGSAVDPQYPMRVFL